MKPRSTRSAASYGRLLLTSVVVLAVGAYWLSVERDAEAPDVRAASSTLSPAVTPASTSAPVVAEAAPEAKPESADPFAPRTWEPLPPPMPLVPAAPPPPQAPPLPFRFFGRITDPGQGTSFTLTRGTEMLTVNVGDRIEPNYRIDTFDGTQLHFTYLPMNIRQTLFVGNTNE